jgi:hypothetical protein
MYLSYKHSCFHFDTGKRGYKTYVAIQISDSSILPPVLDYGYVAQPYNSVACRTVTFRSLVNHGVTLAYVHLSRHSL